MARCPLEAIGVDRALQGTLSPAEAEALQQHLAEDCDACAQVLDRAGCDEEALWLALLGHQQAEPAAQEVDALWQRVAPSLPAPGRVLPMHPRRAAARYALPLAGLAAAAALLLYLAWPAQQGEPVGTTTLKGAALPEDVRPPAEGAVAPGGVQLLLEGAPNGRALDGDTVALGYRLRRDAWLELWQWREGEAASLLQQARMPATGDGVGRFLRDAGQLAYRFEDEAGVHLFVLLASDGQLAEEQARALLRPEWFASPAQQTVLDVAGVRVGVSARRLLVDPHP